MQSAIADRDAARFSSYVDFPALRESVKGQMMALMSRHMSRPEVADNPLAGLGQMMGAALINPIVDAAVSPASVIAMFESGKARPMEGQAGKTESEETEETARYVVAYESWNRVAISKPGNDAERFILKRTGLWSWQLAAQGFPTTVADSTR